MAVADADHDTARIAENLEGPSESQVFRRTCKTHRVAMCNAGEGTLGHYRAVAQIFKDGFCWRFGVQPVLGAEHCWPSSR